MMLTQYRHIQQAKSYSEDVIARLRQGIAALSLNVGSAVVAVGSLARREASEQSDLDYFLILDGEESQRDVLNEVNELIRGLGLRPPSTSGAFAKTINKDVFLATIGGNSESNDDLTRRMLFLLESEWLSGESVYEALFTGVIERYIREGITQHQLARFFLNDLIRYYRTICVDFEYKTGSGGKSWGDRNIKIMFSRKVLYFGGVLAAAETVQSICEFKRAELTRLLRLTSIDRICDVCGHDASRIMNRYDAFLGWLADSGVRELLRTTTADRSAHSDEFRTMKNSGHHLSWELESLLHRRYAPTHPIFQALLL